MAAVPELNKVYGRFKNQGLVLIGIHSDKDEAAGKKAARSAKMTYPVVQDVGMKTSDAYHIQGYPTVLVLDKKGKVRFVYPNNLEAAVKQLLKEK